MNDPRLTPANARVADTGLRGSVDAPRFSDGAAGRVGASVTDLCRTPGGARDRQLLLGAQITVYDDHEGWSFVQAKADGYVGYVRSTDLVAPHATTHRVSARATHVYTRPDFKSPDRMTLSLGAEVLVSGQATERFAQTPLGFVPSCHLAPLATFDPDPVAVAEKLLGTPYLWGGNSAFGIDCSGLVQIALHACGQACPGDSDLQAAVLGEAMPSDTAPRRGDLMFWKGHVAWVAAADRLLHANVHAMAVALEPLEQALDRIAVQGDGPVTRHVRLSF